MAKQRKIRVDGVDIELDIEKLEIEDIDEAQRHSAAQMAFWASVCGLAEREKTIAESHYRHWYAKQADSLLSSDPKLAEWKVSARIEAHETFMLLKGKIAEAIENAKVAEKMYGAWEKRVNAAQSLGARERGEKSAYSRSVTKEKPEEDPWGMGPVGEPIAPVYDRKSEMRKAMKKKKRKENG